MTDPGKAGYWSSVLGGRAGAQNTELLLTFFPDESIFLGGRMCVSGWKGRVEIWSWNCTCQLLPWINCIWLTQQAFIALREYKQNFARLNYPSSSCDTSYPALQQESVLYPLFWVGFLGEEGGWWYLVWVFLFAWGVFLSFFFFF